MGNPAAHRNNKPYLTHCKLRAHCTCDRHGMRWAPAVRKKCM